MSKQSARVFIGNIPFKATEKDVREFFGAYEVNGVTIVTDRETKRPRGFAFVELRYSEDLESAIADLNGRDFGGREARVGSAHERPARQERGGGGRRAPRRERDQYDGR